MGWVGPQEILRALAALEESLNALGHPVERGAGVRAAEPALAECHS